MCWTMPSLPSVQREKPFDNWSGWHPSAQLYHPETSVFSFTPRLCMWMGAAILSLNFISGSSSAPDYFECLHFWSQAFCSQVKDQQTSFIPSAYSAPNSQSSWTLKTRPEILLHVWAFQALSKQMFAPSQDKQTEPAKGAFILKATHKMDATHQR